MKFSSFTDGIEFSPRIAFWVSILTFCIVMLNNQVYLKSLERRDEQLLLDQTRLLDRQSDAERRERVLRRWENDLIARERELKAFQPKR